MDIWGLVWSKLSIRELAQAAGVSREWRREVKRTAAQKRALAAALVTARKDTPNAQLTRPQLLLCAIKRVLLQLNPFTVEPFPMECPEQGAKLYALGFEYDRPREVCGDLSFQMAWIPASSVCENRVETILELHHVDHVMNPNVKERSKQMPAVTLDLMWSPRAADKDCCATDKDNSHKCKYVHVVLRPKGADDYVWMQGLLLALTGGFKGLLRDGRCSSMPGSLASCSKFAVKWEGDCSAADKGLWPAPMPEAYRGLRQRDLGGDSWSRDFYGK